MNSGTDTSSNILTTLLSELESFVAPEKQRTLYTEDEDPFFASRTAASLSACCSRLGELLTMYGPSLLPAVEWLSRLLTRVLTSKPLVSVRDSWDLAALFCTYYPSSGASILTELFELFLQFSNIWDAYFLNCKGTSDWRIITPRIHCLATMLHASLPFVDSSLAQRFASRFAADLNVSALVNAQRNVCICLPHAIDDVLAALILGVRPCPPSVLQQAIGRTSTDIAGGIHCSHRDALLWNAYSAVETQGTMSLDVGSTRAQAMPPLPAPQAYVAAQASVCRLRAALTVVLHPTELPLFCAPAASMVDVVTVMRPEPVAEQKTELTAEHVAAFSGGTAEIPRPTATSSAAPSVGASISYAEATIASSEDNELHSQLPVLSDNASFEDHSESFRIPLQEVQKLPIGVETNQPQSVHNTLNKAKQMEERVQVEVVSEGEGKKDRSAIISSLPDIEFD